MGIRSQSSNSCSQVILILCLGWVLSLWLQDWPHSEKWEAWSVKSSCLTSEVKMAALLTLCPGRIRTLSRFVNGYSFFESTTASNPWNNNRDALMSLGILLKNTLNIPQNHLRLMTPLRGQYEHPAPTRGLWTFPTVALGQTYIRRSRSSPDNP